MKRRRAEKVMPRQKVVVETEISVLSKVNHAATLQAALGFHKQGCLDEAEALYREVLRSQPRHFDALQLLAAIAAQKKNSLEAVTLFDRALKINPENPFVLNNRGNALKELRRYEEALASYESAIERYADYADAYNNRGNVLLVLKRHGEAILSYERAIALKPDNAEAYNNRADVLQTMKRFCEAVVSYDKAIELHLEDAEAYNNRGNALQELIRYEEALLSYNRALELNPDYADAYINRGNALQELMRYEEALLSYNRALELNPDYANAYNNRGNVLKKLMRYEEALASYNSALAINPDYAIAYYNRGIALQELIRYEEALLSYDKALSLKPDYDFLYGMCLHIKMRICEWSDFDKEVFQLSGKIERYEKASTPFPVFALIDSLLLQKETSLIYTETKHSHPLPVAIIPKREKHDKIRIGYYSADFHDHATAYLMAELFEQHDRGTFEFVAFSFGPDKRDAMRQRISAVFDRFIDVRSQSDREVVQLSRELGIDIAVDLKGFTIDSRTGIFALRAAPIQVNYLGYPGTMGADYIDYLIADRTLIPESSRYGYTEKIVYLPDSYQVNDRERRIAERVFSREELGLPERGFVFCCFNNNYKIIPATFDGWMRILKQTEGSVLWLLGDNPKAMSNLRQEATERGVEADRLIFAQRLPLAEHLARHRQADLFLDTFPCNAHTTASDALWAGLPVLTLCGEAFAARVAASLLNAILLPELITTTQEEYETLAVDLAINPEKLARIRRTLAQNRLTTPLFDTQRFALHIEEAFSAMYERYQKGLSPDHIVVSSRPKDTKRLPITGCKPEPCRSGLRVAIASDIARSSSQAHGARLQSAVELHQQGQLCEAEVLYQEILRLQPENFDALQLLGAIVAQRGDFRQAVLFFEQALTINPDHPGLLNNLGNAFTKLGCYDEAIVSYERALAVKPDYAEAFYNCGVALKALKQYEEAILRYDKAIALKPDYAEAYVNRGNALQELTLYEDAIVSYEQAIVLKPENPKVYVHLGNTLLELTRCEEAIVSFERAVALKPDYAESYFNRGIALHKLKRYEEAIVSYECALAIKPDYAESYFNRGIALHKLKRYEEAIISFERAVALKPDYAESYFNRGIALHELKRYEEAIVSSNKAIELNPDSADAYNNRGVALKELKRYEEAIASYECALAIKPDYADVYNNRGLALQGLARYEEAIVSYERALAIEPDYRFLFGTYVHAKMHICNWYDFDKEVFQLSGKIERYEKASTPFPVFALIDSLLLQKETSLIYAETKHSHPLPVAIIPKREKHDKIRIGYYSADFHDHATAYLMAELFEQHDRGKFEFVAFSFGPDKRDAMRQRISAVFDRFIDVRSQSDREVVQLSRELGIDIAVDLKGFTIDSRTGIFALRAAPIQVSYLGYPGTMGADYIDYLIADRTLIPESSRYGYTEKIVYLPDSYQVNDRERRIAERVFKREELGLPERGFVFCCFNNNYKITPATFDGWMRILKQTEGSVLWLLGDNPKAMSNLRQEAIERGVEADRLIFAQRLPLAEHLARHRQADLFLDTFPCNAHTTASDALWAGLPVLTLCGEAFAARVAASLLNAVLLPELITSTQEEYEALAVDFATNPETLARIRRTLAQNRLTTPLFDTQRFARHIEEAYRAMYERYQENLPPDHLSVKPLSLLCKEEIKELPLKDFQPSMAKGECAVSDAARLQSALTLHQQDCLDEAVVLYNEILHSQPRHFDALRLLATIAAQRKDFNRAAELFEQAIKIYPNHPNSLNNQGVVLQELQRYDEALSCFDRALALKPDYAEAYANYGNALQESQCYERALLCYDKALALQPDYAEAYFNRGIALKKSKRYEEALLSYDRLLSLKPDYAEAYVNRGNVLTVLGRYEDALLSYERALCFKPYYVKAYVNQGVALQLSKQYDKAVLSYSNALALQPDYDFLFAERLLLKMRMCDWADYGEQISQLSGKIECREKASTPFPVLVLIDSLLLQKEAALIYAGAKHSYPLPLEIITKRDRHDKIRIGYYSADFHNHATAYLMAELFERHDKSRFELIAFSFGPESHDGMRQRITAAFDRFIDVRSQSDSDVVQLSRKLEIDIAVDLKGFTTDSRAGIFALRAAPIQVNYLGYPGTMGLESLDYLIADRTVIPESSRKYYTEKIVYLPGSYQVNDAKRFIADKVFSREELGLPETGFVFSCFNNNYKITPTLFDGWMRILQKVSESVLWLFEDNPKAADNLRQEAIRRGVDSERLVFARLLPNSEHLARLRLADLFLDTFPCNAHTTASDALWAGLPVLTCMGESFASRVAASLLNAILMPELITSTQEEYEALAVELATNPEKLAQIRQKLARNRFTTPLFDTQLFTRHIEDAYGKMYERYQEDLPPEHSVLLPCQDVSLVLQSALSMHQQGHLEEAQSLYHEILQSDQDHFDALRLLAIIAVQKRKFRDSLVLFDQALKIHPDHATSLFNQGVALQELQRYDDALLCYDRALAAKPDYAVASLNRGIVLEELRRFGEAVLSYDKALANNSDNVRIWFRRGNVLQELKRYDEALLSYDRALALNPDYAVALSNRGIALKELKRYDEALLSYDRALVLKPDYALAYVNRGLALQELKQYDEAVLSYDKAILVKPDYAAAHSDRGIALHELKRFDEAVLSYDNAIAVKPGYAEAYYNRGIALQELMRYEDALSSYNRALLLKPDYDFLYGMCLHIKMQICEWSEFDNFVSQLSLKIDDFKKVATPFSVLSVIDSLLLQKKAAVNFVQEKCCSTRVFSEIPKLLRHDKIRIGYYSADFHDHATAYLMAELFEMHDRSCFELCAFSFGKEKQGEMRKRVTASFDRFFDVQNYSDKDIVSLSRELEVDIAVDLKGFTADSRTGIFALRAAPVQVNYLGYPGTMGAECIDYLIADRTLIPENSRYGYTEKIVYLPDSYQVNDRKRRIADRVFTREELGLPERGFVFCCFNNNYKITPITFDGWMRMLKVVEGSVLWLFEGNVDVAGNLRKEALQRGVESERLVFAKHYSLAEHLARIRFADLFLDTFPCNAHTTASDALWAGLPVLTCMGESFASRVAASLLNAILMPELITSTREEYEALAIELATNPETLAQIRAKLERNRLTTPLFDTRLFTRNIEAAYRVMYERYQEDVLPDHIFIKSAK